MATAVTVSVLYVFETGMIYRHALDLSQPSVKTACNLLDMLFEGYK